MPKDKMFTGEQEVNNGEKKNIELTQANLLEQILKQLHRQEELSQEILKSVRFIKKYYFWQSAFNILKFIILAGIIILGVLSWQSITEFLSGGLKSYIGTQAPGSLDPKALEMLLKSY